MLNFSFGRGGAEEGRDPCALVVADGPGSRQTRWSRSPRPPAGQPRPGLSAEVEAGGRASLLTTWSRRIRSPSLSRRQQRPGAPLAGPPERRATPASLVPPTRPADLLRRPEDAPRPHPVWEKDNVSDSDVPTTRPAQKYFFCVGPPRSHSGGNGHPFPPRSDL